MWLLVVYIELSHGPTSNVMSNPKPFDMFMRIIEMNGVM